MSLHLLPKKSWHVWNDDNLQRVARDEAKAAAENEDKQKKVLATEAEARLSLLRSTHTPARTATEEAAGHIDLFNSGKEAIDGVTLRPDAARVLRQVKGNPEYEAEKRAAEERARKAAGLAEWKFSDVAGTKPWYAANSLHTTALKANNPKNDMLDPLGDMKKYVAATKSFLGIPDVPSVPASKAIPSALVASPPEDTKPKSPSGRRARSRSRSRASRSRSKHGKKRRHESRSRSRSHRHRHKSSRHHNRSERSHRHRSSRHGRRRDRSESPSRSMSSESHRSRAATPASNSREREPILR